MSDTLPERYRPDPWIDRTVNEDPRRSGPDVSIPRVSVSMWVELSPGDRVGVAPRSERAVTVGPTTPRELGSFKISRHHRRGHARAKVPKFALRYVGAEPGDTVRFERVDADRFRIKRMGADQ